MPSTKLPLLLALLCLLAQPLPALAVFGVKFSPPRAGLALPARETAFEFTNDGDTRTFEFTVTTPDGTPVPADVALAYPPVVTVVSGSRQAVRVLWRGPERVNAPTELRLLLRARAPLNSPQEAEINGVSAKSALSLRIFVFNKDAAPQVIGRLLPIDPAHPQQRQLELENPGDGVGRLKLLQWENGARLFKAADVMPRDRKLLTFDLPADADGALKVLVDRQGWVVTQ